MKPPPVSLYDATLRDGAQGEGVKFSVEDKLTLARKMDSLGIDYIEGGWPHPARPEDVEFFREARRRIRFTHSRLTAFGSTRRSRVRAHEDEGLKDLIAARTPAVTIFGKAWDLHVKVVLRVTPEENLAMVGESVRVLKRAGREVVYDAEHFFDGYLSDPQYAIATLRAALVAGADWLVLCDTNGGMIPGRIREVMTAVRSRVPGRLGIHTHNDTECAVANSLVAVELGARQVQGTINGYGERCGNANLCSIIPALKLKLGVDCVSDAQLRQLRGISLLASELVTKPPRDEMPWVGASAFAHKAGVHVHAVERLPRTYEQANPEATGNRRRILVSDMAGLATIRWKAEGYGLKLGKDDERGRRILSELKRLESEGLTFEGAEASFELLVRRITRGLKAPFELVDFRVAVEQKKGASVSEATLKVKVGDQVEHTVAEGDGPVNALDSALRKALGRFYPGVKAMHLTDYRVRVINPQAATAAKVRVTIETTDGADTWSTVGVSENIIEASWQALADSVAYKLFKGKRRKPGKR
ncbi:MAG: citramalate synthase [Candidatus Coatesbacteria bacterium]